MSLLSQEQMEFLEELRRNGRGDDADFILKTARNVELGCKLKWVFLIGTPVIFGVLPFFSDSTVDTKMEMAGWSFIMGLIMGVMAYIGFNKGALEDVEKMRSRFNLAKSKMVWEKPAKEASVVKRGVAGAIIGGVPGAVIGAASAIDKNNKIRSEKK